MVKAKFAPTRPKNAFRNRNYVVKGGHQQVFQQFPKPIQCLVAALRTLFHLGPPWQPDYMKLAHHLHGCKVVEGWTDGPRRDEVSKEHPGLVAYDGLPEAEKVCGRDAAMESLEAIIALDYTITGPTS